MFDLGDEFTIESYRLMPWLIWIQLLVTCLLLLLLFYFSLSAVSISGAVTTSSPEEAVTAMSLPTPPSSSSSSTRSSKSYESVTNNSQLVIAASCSRDAKQNAMMIEDEIIIEETETRTGREARKRGNNHEGEGSSIKDAFSGVLEDSLHPCNYFDIAKQVFLKCLGLDYTSRPCNNGKDN